MANYKDTLQLPQTLFEMRAGLAEKEPAQLGRWRAERLYEAIERAHANEPLFLLHDGPPYANGHLHHGHILNKILKDIVVKERTMSGQHAPYVPGWDCHGLPVEVGVEKELGPKKATMSKLEVRRACRAYAERFVKIQREEFERLGVFGRWDEPYLTMSPSYEAQTLRELAKIVAHGLVYKGLRPVNWCATHQTALAEAEVEYEDHSSPSIYVALALVRPPAGVAQETDLVIWTTTPWTLPANLAVAAHPDFEYVAYPVRGRLRLVALGLIESFLAAVGEPPFEAQKVAARYKGKDLTSLTYRRPLGTGEGPVLLGEHVTLEAGTGLVHTAPGHGVEDFELGKKHGLPTLSPVDGCGAFTAECGIPELVGVNVFKANERIVEMLVERSMLLNRPGDTVTHRYAHCWRCHRPIVTRATEQWWVALDKPYAEGPSLRERALAVLPKVTWIPAWGYDRIRGMLATRPDWCLSRQRTWGVPIVVAYCNHCGEAVLDTDRMMRVADWFEKEGADAWFERSLEELMGPLSCKKCGGNSFRKEEDILDVWFDSGVSFAAVVERQGFGHAEGAPVDFIPLCSVPWRRARRSRIARCSHMALWSTARARRSPKVKGTSSIRLKPSRRAVPRCCACGWRVRTTERTFDSRTRF
jgi:isoleucyl-tRNA synthetase